MEEDRNQPEHEQAKDEKPLDAVDHARLSRLVIGSAAPTSPTPPLPPTASRYAEESWQATTPYIASQATSYAPAQAPTAKRSAPGALIVIALIALALLGAAVPIYFLTRSSAPGVAEEKLPTTGKESTGRNPVIRADMVSIPAGTFQMGRSDGLTQESPPHAVTVGAFQMDRTEVTNAEYAQFIGETGHTAPVHFVSNKPMEGQENWPVVNVSLEDAKAFAAWRSKRDGTNYRLPTEEEWEYAARNGDQNNLYPWGNSWEANRAVTRDAAPESLKPVGSLADGKNRWGVVDLVGNVWEWTSSKASIYPGGKGQIQPEHKDWNIIRGGSILSDPKGDKPISSTYRDWVKPTTVNPYLGFRLVRGG